MPASSATRLELIGDVIERSRFATSSSRLSDKDLAEAARSWDDALRDIPTERIDALYQEALRDRDVRGPFLPQEIVAVWRAQRKSGERASRYAPCGLCDGSGWQILAIHCPTLSRDHTRARPCGCSNAQFPREPKRPPNWERADDGAWYPANAEAALRCTCLGCEETGKFPRSSLRYDGDPDALPRRA